MIHCPYCQVEVEQDFGLVQCPQCNKNFFIHVDGGVELYTESGEAVVETEAETAETAE